MSKINLGFPIPFLIILGYHFKKSWILLTLYDLYICIGILTITLAWTFLSAYKKANIDAWRRTVVNSTMSVRKYISGTYLFWICIFLLIYEKCYLTTALSLVLAGMGITYHTKNYIDSKKLLNSPDVARVNR